MATTVSPPRNRQTSASTGLLGLLGWAALAFLSIAIAGISARYFSPTPPFPAEILKQRIAAHDPWLLVHIVGGVFALATGPFQFSRRLRLRYVALHRWLGRFYLIMVAMGATAGFRIALESFGGLPSHFGFGMLAVLWLITAAMAYRRALQRRWQSHREWMVRNFALTFAAVTLRLWLPFMAGWLRIPFEPAYVTISWLCWVPNLLVAEVLANRSKHLAL